MTGAGTHGMTLSLSRPPWVSAPPAPSHLPNGGLKPRWSVEVGTFAAVGDTDADEFGAESSGMGSGGYCMGAENGELGYS
mmetsp:Transcript_2880/g.6009  ORF Transcript_2880/g.6009 Transcript_2880/m.6009 type:complete len:80 (+) Transcript_2880:383-622(+)